MAERKETIRPTDDEAIALARRLLRTARHGALATLDPASGWPAASRVAVASDHDGAPLVLVSELAAHSSAMKAEARCSILLGEPGKGDPLAHARITIVCLARQVGREAPEHDRIRGRFLRRNPKAKLYAGFADFSFFRLEPQQASLNGGFGKAFELSRTDLLLSSSALDDLAVMEERAVSHMNDDHAGAVRHYAKVAGAAEGPWRLTGIDPEGMDIAEGDRVLRVLFPSMLNDASELRVTLSAMAKAGC